MKFLYLLLSLSFALTCANTNEFSTATNVTTSAPSDGTVAPSSSNVTASPTNNSNTTTAPTVAPTNSSNVTTAPTVTPTNSSNTTTSPTVSPTVSPTTKTPTTLPPTTNPPTPTPAPTIEPTMVPQHHTSIFKIIGRTIAWLILVTLSVLLFGAIMSNRYRIYYFLRGVWYSILQMQCTRSIIHKLHLGRFFGWENDGRLNTIIFDQGDPSEGLLLQEESTI